MKNLNANWITEGWIDFEYKQYILLDYLQKVEKSFGRKNLYPVLSDLVFHYNNLVNIRENKNLISEQIPKKLDHIDLNKLKMVYRDIDLKDDLMEELEKVIDFAIPLFRNHLQKGKDLFEWVESQIEVDVVGLRPIYDKEGYLLIAANNLNATMVYKYKMSQIQGSDDNYFALHTELVAQEDRSLANHYNNLKLKLVKENKDLPNPATFVVESKAALPFKNTLLPVAERVLMRTLNTAA